MQYVFNPFGIELFDVEFNMFTFDIRVRPMNPEPSVYLDPNRFTVPIERDPTILVVLD